MTTFLRLLNDKDKAEALYTTSQMLRRGESEPRVFEVAPESFKAVPGAPFAYWVSDAVRGMFEKLPAFESDSRFAQHGASTKDDFRFLRIWWENENLGEKWFLFAKGGSFSPFYADIYLMVNWKEDAKELEASLLHKYPYLGETANWVLHRECSYFHPGLSYPPTALGYVRKGLGMYILPRGCIFGHKACSLFVDQNNQTNLLVMLALLSSSSVDFLMRVMAQSRSWEVGHLRQIPIPYLSTFDCQLSTLSKHAWSLKRKLDTVVETSHAFHLPLALQSYKGDFDPPSIEAELVRIQAEIDAIAFDLYGFSEVDRIAVCQSIPDDSGADADPEADEEEGTQTEAPPADHQTSLLSWAVGVAFGRFDWRLATGERKAPPEPDPFDPLPSKSTGMLPDDTEPFHTHTGILVDDSGHPHDLTHLVEEVLERVNMPVPNDVRQWLQRKFFAFHLKTYSKSRRKAPIYWPLSTSSGSYTLWVYYPSLNDQTLYSAINDFVDGPNGKLTQVGNEVAALRMKGAGRSQEDERLFEKFQAFELELIELRDTLFDIAQNFHPNPDDGVQITAAPLWQLFGHKPWQKVLKETWAKLEKGDFDWAHLAMNYWPARVCEKCTTDKSLAIAHGLEELYVEPPVKPKKGRGKETKES